MPMFESLLNSTHSGGGGGSSAMPAMHQAHALAHGQHGPPGGRVSHPGNGHRARPRRRRQKKKRGKKKLAVSGNGYQDGYSLTGGPGQQQQPGHGYGYGYGSPSLSRPLLLRNTSAVGSLPQLSSPPPMGKSPGPGKQQQHAGMHRDTDSPSYRDYKKQQTKQQRPRRRGARAQQAQQQPVEVSLSDWASEV
jgi:hypothetical protein